MKRPPFNFWMGLMRAIGLSMVAVILINASGLDLSGLETHLVLIGITLYAISENEPDGN